MSTTTRIAAIMINGYQLKVKDGETILDAACAAGIYIPALCSYRSLRPLPKDKPDMACQLCIVEVNGKTVLACDTKVTEGMEVNTESPAVKELRRRTLTEILRRHPNVCLVCNRRERCLPTDTCLRSVTVEERCVMCPENGTCELQKAVDHIGIDELPPYTPKKLTIREDSPVFLRDHNLCILCERCVRVCDEIRGARAIEFAFPCYRACPAGIDIPRYLRLVGRGRPSAALAVIREKVPFPGVLGRVCIHPCEQACQRGLEVDKPLQIRMVKRFAADNGDDSWKRQSKRMSSTGKTVAVIGAGPAGLTAAYYLAKQGHAVIVFEALSQPGGMMLAGIPEYRLPRNILSSEIDEIRNVGVEIILNTRVSSLDDLLRSFGGSFDAVFLGLGAHQGQKLGVDGENLPGVIEAVEFLRRGNLGERLDVGKKVGIVGGGNVAIDAARMALRFGAEKVTVFYRRTRIEMPASPEEVEAALREGVEMSFLSAPSKVAKEGDLLRLECRRMKLGEPDTSGRARPVEVPGSEFITELDTLLVAVGQRPDVPVEMGVDISHGNIVRVDSNMQTTRMGVFSAGDCVSGPASVIAAIAGARAAASAIDRFLGGNGDISETLVPPEEATCRLREGTAPESYATTAYLPSEISKTGFDEVEQAWNPSTAMAEANRCLKCYVITPQDDKALNEAGCQFCGACVDACPTGALVERTAYLNVGGDHSVTSVCPYCGVGCRLRIDTKGNKIVRVVPDGEGPANAGQACVKGKFGLDFVFHPERLKVPLLKSDAGFVKTTWDEALNIVARRLMAYRPDEVAVISSEKNTNEDNYVAQKFTRTVLGSNTIDHRACLSHASAAAGLAVSFGVDAMTNSISEISAAECILAIGKSIGETHPVIALEMIKAAGEGRQLIIANPHESKLNRFATLWLRQRPGTDDMLLMGMARIIVDEGLADMGFVNSRCENFDIFKDSLKTFDLNTVSAITGISANDIMLAARMYATNKPATILHPTCVTRDACDTDVELAIANLAMLTGNVGKLSSGVNLLRSENNTQGACDMGALPNMYPGYQPVTDATIKKKFEYAWGQTLNENTGLALPEIFDGVYKNRIKALYIIGADPILANPDSLQIRDALDRVELLIYQSSFLGEAGQLADVVLPASTLIEKDGTFTNTERRVQRVRKVVEPAGNAKPDWWITCQIAKRMGGRGFDYESPAGIMAEIARLTPIYGGISYEHLEKGGLQWPCPSTDHPGTSVLHADVFTRGKGLFLPLRRGATREIAEDRYPLVLTAKRSLSDFLTGMKAREAPGVRTPTGLISVEISLLDALTLSIADGDKVKVISKQGDITALARVSSLAPLGVVSIDVLSLLATVNVMTDTARGIVAKIAEHTIFAVRIERK